MSIPGCGWLTSAALTIGDLTRRSHDATRARTSSRRRNRRTTAGHAGRASAGSAQDLRGPAWNAVGDRSRRGRVKSEFESSVIKLLGISLSIVLFFQMLR